MAKIQVADQQKFEFQKAVLTKGVLTPPGSPVMGDRYLINGIGTGAWAGQNGNIAMWDGATWMFAVKVEGMIVWVKDEDKFYAYNGTVWSLIDLHAHSNKTLLDSYTQSEVNLADAVSKKHTAGSEGLGGDLSGTAGAAVVDEVGGKTSTAIATAVDATAAIPALVAAAPVYNAGLGVIEFDLP